jgi:hypothetical protein
MQIWSAEKNLRWVPTALDYLRSEPWDKDPIAMRRDPAELKRDFRDRQYLEYSRRRREQERS